MMLASAVLGKSMLGGGLLSHFFFFTRRILPSRSIPAQLSVHLGTLNGPTIREQHEAEFDIFIFAKGDNRPPPVWCVCVRSHGGDSS